MNLSYGMQNDYPLSILLGEGVIGHIGKILRNPECETGNGIDREELTEIINNLIGENENIKQLNERMAVNEQHVVEIRGELNNLTTIVNTVESKVDTIVAANEKADKKADALAVMMQQMLSNQQQAMAPPQLPQSTSTTRTRKTKNTEC
jgi:hypothetical protein